jgi:outer membrane protein assembly factor BamA
LQEAIRRQIPSYDGTAPETGDMPEKIKAALQTLLDERKIPGQVDYMYSADLAGKNAKHFFSIKGMKIPICALLFPGAQDIKESELIKTSRPLINQDYSSGDIKAFARVNLIPLYRQRGHLRASFLDPEVKPQSDENCQNGVSISMQVDEGSVYTWDKAEWSGNEVLSAQDLSIALGMKNGERADGLKIDKGPINVISAYGKKGYIEPRIKGVAAYDDANRRVSYSYTVTEGPQYRMGNLEIKGLPEDLTKRLMESWKLQRADAFDTSYFETFMKKAAMEMAAAGLRVSEGNTTYKPNRDNRTVDVIVTIK